MTTSLQIKPDLQKFLEEILPYCSREHEVTSQGILVTLKASTVQDPEKYLEIDSQARKLGGKAITHPNQGFIFAYSFQELKNEPVNLFIHESDIEDGGPQPRTKIDIEDPKIKALYDSIEFDGQRDPIKVTPSPITPGKYQVRDGHCRRFVIFNLLRKQTIWAVSEKRSELETYKDAFILNSTRNNLSDYDQGHYIVEVLMKRFPSAYPTFEAVANALSLDKAEISRIVTSYKIIEDNKGTLSNEQLTRVNTLEHRTVYQINQAKEELKPKLLASAIDNDLSVRDMKKVVDKTKAVADASFETVDAAVKEVLAEKNGVLPVVNDAEKVFVDAQEFLDEGARAEKKSNRLIDKYLAECCISPPEVVVNFVVSNSGSEKLSSKKMSTVLSCFFELLIRGGDSLQLKAVLEEAKVEAQKWVN